MTNELITANKLRAHLIDDEGWTPHEVRDMLLAEDGTHTYPRTEADWVRDVANYVLKHPELKGHH